jgi:hydroxypyruvate reductase
MNHAATHQPAKELLRRMFDAAIASAQPARCIPPHLPAAPKGRLIVIGAGKASAAMAQALEAHWPVDKSQLEGLVVTHYGYAVPSSPIEIVEAAAERMLQRVSGLHEDDLVLCLISGTRAHAADFRRAGG